MLAEPARSSHSRPSFLFTDIIDSARISPGVGYSAYRDKLQPEHDYVLCDEIKRYRGGVEGTAGDSFFAVFPSAENAVACAIAIQERLCNNPITEKDRNGKLQTIAVRIGVHTAVTEMVRDAQAGYRSHPDVNFASRVMSQAGAGQILVSDETHRLVRELLPHKWQEWPGRWIKGYEVEPQAVYELLWDAGETRGEPGLRWMPSTILPESSRYIARPDLEELVRKHFAKPQNNGMLPRMVTLWGYGGIGKTRVALACALKSVGSFSDGVYFIPLAGRPASAQVIVEGICEAIEKSKFANLHQMLPENVSKLDDLLPALREKSALLILDNYESVSCKESQEFLHDLLQETRHLRLLLTSREAVHLDIGEKEVEVTGLTDEQATELFIDRARLKPGRNSWQPTTGNEQDAMRRILTQSERIPLAIELLAAWMGLRELQEVADELEQMPLPVLPQGHVHLDKSERHQSLEKCLEYSYGLLREPSLQKGFACLSLFADNFTAESVSGSCGIADAQQLLDSLYEAALVSRSVDEERTRYSMLRPTRSYAGERFRALPDADNLRALYVTYYSQLVMTNADTSDPRQAAAIEREWRNALAAVDYAEAADDGEALLQLWGPLDQFLMLGGRWLERQRLGRVALNVAQIAKDPLAVGLILFSLSWALLKLGTLSEAEGYCRELIVVLKRRREVRALPIALTLLGTIYHELRLWKQAEQAFRRSLLILRLLNERPPQVSALSGLGIVYSLQEKNGRAENCFRKALAISQEFESKDEEATVLGNLGNLYRHQARYIEAEEAYDRSTALKGDNVNRHSKAEGLLNIAMLYDSQQRWAEAEQALERSLVTFQEHRDGLGEARAIMAFGLLFQHQSNWDKAESWFIRGQAQFKSQRDRLGEGQTLANRALICEARGRRPQALALAKEALDVLDTTEDRNSAETVRRMIARWEGKLSKHRWWPFGK